ncbi:MAG: AsmA-like C-terminal domain-containing protein, partial [Pseudomonadota bacterium]
DASKLIEAFFANGGMALSDDDRQEDPKARPNLSITASLNELELRDGVILDNAAFKYLTSAGGLKNLDFAAIDQNGAAHSIKGELGRETSTEPQADELPDIEIVRATSADLGALMRGLFTIESINNGIGAIELDLAPNDTAQVSGRVFANAIRIKDAPLLAKVFAAGSLSGLTNILNGDGIEISDAGASFTLRDGGLRISEFKAVGPSIGLTAQGEIGLNDTSQIDLSGAVAPAYGLNSILGRTPLLGDLFVNRDGEGIIALSYRVSGKPERPTVTVNPLSALAPGMFRRIMEPSRVDKNDESPTVEDETQDVTPRPE